MERAILFFDIDEITRVEDLQAYGNVLSDYFITTYFFIYSTIFLLYFWINLYL